MSSAWSLSSPSSTVPMPTGRGPDRWPDHARKRASVDGAVSEHRLDHGAQALRQLILVEVGGLRPPGFGDGDLVAEAVGAAWGRRISGGQGSQQLFRVAAGAG